MAYFRPQLPPELEFDTDTSFEGKFGNFPPVKSYPKPAQKPHPPIIIGAGGLGAGNERALRDTVAMGDGWMPIVLTPLQLAEEMSKLRKMCAEAGRSLRFAASAFLPRLHDAQLQTPHS